MVKNIMEENSNNAHYFSEDLLKVYISSTYKVKPHVNSSKMTLYKHHCVKVMFSEKNSYSQVNCFTRFK